MSQNVLRCASLAVALASGALAAPTFAEDYNSDWSHQVGITGFVFNLKGDAGVGPQLPPVEIDFDIGDVLERLDGGITFLIQGDNKQYGYWLSYEYLELADDASFSASPGDLGVLGLNAKLKADFSTGILDTGLAYYLSDEVQLIGGIRAWDVDEDFKFSVTGNIAGELVNRSAGVGESWLDAFAGIRARVPLAPCWSLNLRADMGAGDSNSSYQGVAMVAFDHDNNWTTSAGIRYLSVDYENDGFMFDMEMTGFEVAALYRF